MKRIVLLLILFGSINVAIAQRATKIEKISEDRWEATIPITPQGKTGPYIPNFKVIINLQTINSGDDSGADAVGVGLQFATGGVVKYRYQGLDYVDDANMKLEVGVCTGFYEFSYRITVANAGSISASSKDFAKIPIGKKLNYKEAEALKGKLAITSFEITGYELVQSDLDYIGRRVDAKKKGVEQQIQSNQTSDSSTSQTSTQGNAQSESGQNTNAAKNVDIVQVAQAHNATEKAKSDALTNASNQTFDQWTQGNYIQGAKPLVDEFARQGNATGAYGTAGVAVAAEIGSAIGDAVAAKRARKAEETAYNYELDRGREAYYAKNYKEAFSLFSSSYGQKKNVSSSKIYMAVQMLHGNGIEKNQTLAIRTLKEYAPEEPEAKGYAAAYYHLAVAYLLGEGVPRDYASAQKLFKLAQHAEYTVGNYYFSADQFLGFMTLKGLGVDADPDGARRKYFPSSAGLNGNLYTNYALGKIYEKGIGVEVNYNKAFEHYAKSARWTSVESYHEALRLIEQYGAYIERNKMEKFLKDAKKNNYVNNKSRDRALARFKEIWDYPDEYWKNEGSVKTIMMMEQ